ncbi:MAG TPA: glycine/sarcosine/betaine reductase selenoprotein B family protein [Nitrospinota bacterium]|jgi:D-proline reductase (dithiol) PrdB|nr:glycine/sarcosine/betaine reductase selenoprotein B family protein [Nitrospinota bacterium]|tara:strand:+ start:123401 stop:123919 length:519 start_codon:yes stop_codon:yes gene_type:complete
MSKTANLKTKLRAWLYTRFPFLAHKAAAKIRPFSFENTPWAPIVKPLSEIKVSIVTTSGVHLNSDLPFNMEDETGDPSYRIVPSDADISTLTITHNYYNHSDADRDINIVFPIERMREYVDEGRIGSLANQHYGMMGHIRENHLGEYMNKWLPEVAKMMKEDSVDCALITPG